MKINCDNCKIEFNKKPSQIKLSNNHFCSRKCFSKFNTKKIILYCNNCNLKIEKTQSQIIKSNKKNGLHFCNKKCAGIYKKGEKSGNWKGGLCNYRKIHYRKIW